MLQQINSDALTLDWAELKNKSITLGLGDWSYHKVKMVNSCPLLFQETFLKPHTKVTDKTKHFQGVSTKVGIMLHSMFETCMRAPAIPVEMTWLPLINAYKPLNAELVLLHKMREPATKLITRIRTAIAKYDLKVYAELKMQPQGIIAYADFVGMTQDGKSVLLLDYKSHGESDATKESIAHQLSFYTLCIMLLYPEVTSVKAGCVYIPEESIKYQPVVYRDRLLPLEKYWYDRLNTATTLLTELKDARPNGEDFPYFKGDACKWCTKENCLAKQKKKPARKTKKKLIAMGA